MMKPTTRFLRYFKHKGEQRLHGRSFLSAGLGLRGTITGNLGQPFGDHTRSVHEGRADAVAFVNSLGKCATSISMKRPWYTA